MTRDAALTGAGPTIAVAIEQCLPKDERIIDDRYAPLILPTAMRVFVSLARAHFVRDLIFQAGEKTTPGIWAGVLCRKRYIDDKLAESMDQIHAVVDLGAGWETRPYRLAALAATRIWEADQPENIEAKRNHLRRLFGKQEARVKLVPIDFDRENLPEALALHGYRAEDQTFFVLEAVTQYLSESGVRGTFAFLSRAATGSRLTFTYVRKDFIDGRERYGQEILYRRYVTPRRLWFFGLDPEEIANFLASYGWRLIEHYSYEELAERYVKPTGRVLASTPIERIVYAEKA
jgi:methyltransferase (TIGR00027 family)